jgi:hypothetical protein
MLRGTGERRASSWPTHGTVVGLLGATALLISSLGSPATPPGPEAATARVEPFELGYLGAEAMGFVAFRPAVCFKEPGMDQASRKIDDGVGMLKKMGLIWPAALRPENIDQIVTDICLGSQGTGKPNSRSLQFGASSVMIRLNRDFDWLAFFTNLDREIKETKGLESLRSLLGDIKEIHEGTITIYRLGAAPSPMSVYCYFPDSRTAVVTSRYLAKSETKENDNAKPMLQLIHNVSTARQRDWGSGITQFDHSPFALVLDNKNGHYGRAFANDVESKDLKILEAIKVVTLGTELGDGRPVRLIVDAQSPSAVPDLEKAFDGYAGLVLKAVRNSDGTPDKDVGQVVVKLFTDLMQSRQVHRQGSSLEWQAFSSVRVHHLVEDALQESKHVVKTESKGK